MKFGIRYWIRFQESPYLPMYVLPFFARPYSHPCTALSKKELEVGEYVLASLVPCSALPNIHFLWVLPHKLPTVGNTQIYQSQFKLNAVN